MKFHISDYYKGFFIGWTIGLLSAWIGIFIVDHIL